MKNEELRVNDFGAQFIAGLVRHQNGSKQKFR
jgi:hypothetical protein